VTEFVKAKGLRQIPSPGEKVARRDGRGMRAVTYRYAIVLVLAARYR